MPSWAQASRQPERLPLLFALDAQLGIADGFRYSLDCRDRNSPVSGSNYCASHIGCTSGCSGDGYQWVRRVGRLQHDGGFLAATATAVVAVAGAEAAAGEGLKPSVLLAGRQPPRVHQSPSFKIFWVNGWAPNSGLGGAGRNVEFRMGRTACRGDEPKQGGRADIHQSGMGQSLALLDGSGYPRFTAFS